MKKVVKIALCDRHEMPNGVNGSIFGATIDDPMAFDKMEQVTMDYIANAGLEPDDTIHLYVTGLTAAVVAVINACAKSKIRLTLYHYNRDTGEYTPQLIFIGGKE